MTSDSHLFGELSSKLPFAVEPAQRAAWIFQISHLRSLAQDLPEAYFLMEFLIPRMGRRADLIILNHGIIFVVEYKIGATGFDRSSLAQTYGYGLDLKHFHETSHHRTIVPILVATEATLHEADPVSWDDDSLAHPIRCSPDALAPQINFLSRVWGGSELDPASWESGRYRPPRRSSKRRKRYSAVTMSKRFLAPRPELETSRAPPTMFRALSRTPRQPEQNQSASSPACPGPAKR